MHNAANMPTGSDTIIPLSRRSLIAAGSVFGAAQVLPADIWPPHSARQETAVRQQPEPEGSSGAPRIWIQPPNHGGAGRLPPDFAAMFTTRIAAWSEARQATAAWIVRMTSLAGREAPLETEFVAEHLIPALNDWDIPLVVNVTGATLPDCGTGRRLAIEADQVQRLVELGGHVVALSLQSSLSKVGGRTCPGYGRGRDVERRIDGIVRYAAFMRARFPALGIGLVDAMPAKGWAYQEVYRQLVAALEREGLSLAFIHLDCPVESAGPTANVVRSAESFVQAELGLPFGWICVSKVGGATSNVAYRDAVLAGYAAYREAGGHPDRVILTSWYRYPDLMLPEDDEAGAPFMNLVRDVARLDGARKASAAATPVAQDTSP